jgi:hypothetical protein
VDKLEKVMEKVTTLVQKLATTQQKANKLADQVAKKVDVMMNEMLLKITKEEVLKLERQLSEARESGGKEEQKKVRSNIEHAIRHGANFSVYRLHH